MGIYQRDNINYQGMIANMLANRQHGAEIRSNAMRNQGQMWGNTISGIGNTFGNALLQYGQQQDAAKQQELENTWKAQQIDYQNRQLEQQRDLALKQMDLSRELAGQQKAETAAANQDEFMKNWQIANARLNAAKAKYGRSTGDPQAAAEYADAKFTEEYWRKKANVNVPDMTQPAPTVQPVQETAPVEPIKTNEDYMAELNTALAGKWNDEALANANSIIDNIKDPALKEKAKQAIIAKGATAEQKAAAAATTLKNDQASFSKMNAIEKRTFLKNNPQYTATGGKLAWAKKKK